MGTKIEWTNETWNTITGCEPISPGCKNCYAEKMAYRLSKIKTTKHYQNVINQNGWNGKTHFQESQLNKPLKWKKPRMIFVVSMGDLFHESVPFSWIDRVFNIIAQTPHHTYQILTKRPEIMAEYFKKNPPLPFGALSNVWLGATVENQDQMKRVRILLEIPAKIHFVSVEPMLSEIDFNQYFFVDKDDNYLFKGVPERDRSKLIHLLDWVICGGESGHNARPIHPDWVRSLKDQCEAASVPFFFKQWHKKSDGSELDGKEYKQMPKSV